MSSIIFESEVTEYAVISDKEYENVSFCIHDNCIVVSFMDKSDEVLTQAEISIEDARKLARLILL